MRRPDDVIHHSDQRSQYTSIAFGKRCRDVGMRPSPGSVDDCYDNAMCESFFTTVKCELLDRHRFRSRAEALMAVFEFLEGRDNPRRRHSAVGYLSPINYERSQLSPRLPRPITVHETGATPIASSGFRWTCLGRTLGWLCDATADLWDQICRGDDQRVPPGLYLAPSHDVQQGLT